MKRLFVLDSSAFLDGFNPTNLEEITFIMPKSVIAEIKDLNSKARLENYIAARKIIVVWPEEATRKKVRDIATKLGDLVFLSDVDIDVISVALSYKLKNENVSILSNDYTIANISRKLGIKGDIKRRFKRTVWRNTTYNFIFATIFSHSSFNPQNFEFEFEELLKGSKSLRDRLKELKMKYYSLFPELDFELNFKREKGSPPELFFFESFERSVRISAINFLKKQIKEKINILKKNDYVPSDLLIIVPDRGQYYKIVIKSLNELNIKYIDYVSNENRRIPANPDEVRIVTFHSSRGIEGALTIILGFEEIYKFEESNIYNLAFTILTRAIFNTTLFSMYNCDFDSKPTCLENLEKLNKYLRIKLKSLADEK